MDARRNDGGGRDRDRAGLEASCCQPVWQCRTARKGLLMKMSRESLAVRIGSIAMSAVACGVALAVVANASGARTTDAAVASCKTSGLVVWLDTRGNAAAGSVFYTLKFTNQSGQTCSLIGYPGVSAVDLRGHRLGSAGSRTPSGVHLVSLPNGATASALLRIVQAANFPQSACHRVAAGGLRIYPPNQTASKVIPIPFEACSRTGPVYLSVKAVARGG